MMQINELRRINVSDLLCRATLGDNSFAFTISVMQLEPALRSMRLLGLSAAEKFNLMNASEFRAFTKLFWNVVDGQTVQLPVLLESDW